MPIEITNKEILEAINAKSRSTATYMQETNPRKYELLQEGLKFEKLKAIIGTEDAEELLLKAAEMIALIKKR